MATLVDQLLKADVKKASELKVGTFPSKRLAKILGKEEPVEIQIKEIPARKLNDLSTYQYDKKGNQDISKGFDARLLVCVEGIVEPGMKDKELQEHFGCATPKDLAEKIFGGESIGIADAIANLSDYVSDEDVEDELKN